MGRAPCCQKVGLNRGAWTAEEDNRLVEHILKYGHSNWRQLPKQAGLLRCGKSCRLRWINYLRPDIKRGSFTEEEEDTLIKLHAMLGNKWSRIASYLPGRTDNEIKNVWNTHIKKKLAKSKEDNGPSANKHQQSASSSSISCIDQHIPESENQETTNQKPDNAEDEINLEIAMDPAELWNILDDEGTTLQDQVQELDPDEVSHTSIYPYHANFANSPIEPGLNEGLQIGPILKCIDSRSKPSWLAELEQDLDLWETATTEDANHQEGDDPVCSYFKMPPTSQSIFNPFP